MHLSRLRIILTCLGLLALMPSKELPAQEDLSLDQILERACQTEKAFKENLKDYTCQVTSTVLEPQKDGQAKTLVVVQKTIYRKLPDKRLEKYNSVTKDGRSFSPEEVLELQNGQKPIPLGRGRSFFGPEERANYHYELLPSDTVRGIPSHVLRIKPIEKKEDLVSGRIWLHQGNFEVVKVNLCPTKKPLFLKKANVILDFSQVQPGIWLPSNVSVDAQAGFLFIKRNRLIREAWRDFQINVGLPDSIFSEEDQE